MNHDTRRWLPRRLRDWMTVIERVRVAYRRTSGRELALLSPRRFTEKMQWRKLFDLNPAYAIFCDKAATHRYLAERVDRALLPELLFVGDDPDAVPLETLPRPFVLKSTHGWSQTIIVWPGQAIDAADIRRELAEWLTYNHGRRMVEPGYEHLRPGILAERYLGDRSGEPLPERKLYVFDGKVHFVQSILVDPATRERRMQIHRPDWTRLYWRGLREPFPTTLRRPLLLEEMIAMAERLAAGFDFLRVDFYDAGERFYIGEITVYSYSGLANFEPDEADFVLGAPWRLKSKRWRAAKAVLFRRHAIHPPQAAGRSFATRGEGATPAR